jgi:hypothetical protein
MESSIHPSSSPAAAAKGRKVMREMRYSLEEILEEIRAEDKASLIGRETVDQSEIGKLFGTRKKRKQRKQDGK